GIAQHGEYLAWLCCPALWRLLRFALCLRGGLCCGLLVGGSAKFCFIASLLPGGFFLLVPLLLALLPGFLFPRVVLVFIVEGIDAPAAHHLRQFCFTAYVGEALDTIAFGILHEVELTIEKVVMLQGDGAFFMYNQGDGTMYAADP